MNQESAVALAVSLTALLAPSFIVDVVKRDDGDGYVLTIDHDLEETTR